MRVRYRHQPESLARRLTGRISAQLGQVEMVALPGTTMDGFVWTLVEALVPLDDEAAQVLDAARAANRLAWEGLS